MSNRLQMIINSTTTKPPSCEYRVIAEEKTTRKRNHRHNTDNELGNKFTRSAQNTIDAGAWATKKYILTYPTKDFYELGCEMFWRRNKKVDKLKLNERFLTSTQCVLLFDVDNQIHLAYPCRPIKIYGACIRSLWPN